MVDRGDKSAFRHQQQLPREMMAAATGIAKPYRVALLVREFVPNLGGLESWASALAEALLARGHAVRMVTTRLGKQIPGMAHTLVETADTPLRQAQLFAAEARPGEIMHDTGVGLGGDVFQPQMGSISLNIARNDAAYPLRQRLQRAFDRGHRRSVRDMAALEIERLRRARHVVAVSRETAGRFQARFGVPAARMTVIANGIDTSRFTPEASLAARPAARARLGLAPDAVMLLLAAQNFRLKGVQVAIRALALLRGRHPGMRLLVAGAGEIEAFSALAARHGVAEQVRFLGQVEDMPALFAAADVFVHPTFHDACSLATLEALACGLPVITTRRNGAADGMTNGREGWVLKAPEAGALAAAIGRLAREEQRQPMRAAARRLAEQHDFRLTVDRLEAVYAKVAG